MKCALPLDLRYATPTLLMCALNQSGIAGDALWMAHSNHSMRELHDIVYNHTVASVLLLDMVARTRVPLAPNHRDTNSDHLIQKVRSRASQWYTVRKLRSSAFQ